MQETPLSDRALTPASDPALLIIAAQKEIAYSPSNRYFAAFGPSFRTAVYDSRTMKRIGRYKAAAKLVAFQYDTGLVAVVPIAHDSKVAIWDFKYERTVKEIDFVQPIVKLGYMRNLLIVASLERLIMNDLASGSNTVYLPLVRGDLAFFSSFYEKLRVAYFRSPSTHVNLSLWDGQKSKLEEIEYSKGKFDYLGETMMLFSNDGIMIYRERCLTNRVKYTPEDLLECLFDSNGLNPATGVILVLEVNNTIEVAWHPIYRLAKQDEKRITVTYTLKYEQILEEDPQIDQNTFIYLRQQNLYVSRPGSTCQVYGRHETVE